MDTQTRLRYWMRLFMAAGWTLLAIVSVVRVVGHSGPRDMPYLPYLLPPVFAFYAVRSWLNFRRIVPRKASERKD